jgi:alanine dehydrogenase
MAVRLDSVVQEFGQERAHLHMIGDQFCGLVILFSLESGEPLAMIHDFTLSGIRVGATTAVAAKHMAKKDAKRVALFGSGKQARTNLEAVSKVRQLEEVRVYSPNESHRRLFAEEMTEVIGAEIIPVDNPQKAMDGAEIVLCMANSMTPVFDGKWLQPGMHVASISAGRDKAATEVRGFVRREIDDLTMERSALIVISSKDQVAWDDQRELRDPAKPAADDWGKIVELGDLLTGRVSGRGNEAEINLYASNTGTGNQFAAAGAIVYNKAKAKGIGREIPTEWLMTSVKEWSDRGFFPSP